MMSLYTRIVIVLFFLFANKAFSCEKTSHCLSDISHADTLILQQTKKELVFRASVYMPTSANAYRILKEAKLKSNPPPCVLLSFSIDMNGAPHGIHIRKSYPSDDFDSAAIRSLEKFQFRCESKECMGRLYILSFSIEE